MKKNEKKLIRVHLPVSTPEGLTLSGSGAGSAPVSGGKKVK